MTSAAIHPFFSSADSHLNKIRCWSRWHTSNACLQIYIFRKTCFVYKKEKKKERCFNCSSSVHSLRNTVGTANLILTESAWVRSISSRINKKTKHSVKCILIQNTMVYFIEICGGMPVNKKKWFKSTLLWRHCSRQFSWKRTSLKIGQNFRFRNNGTGQYCGSGTFFLSRNPNPDPLHW
jgi:hypothetical protein